MTYEEQYINLCNRIVYEGIPIKNERTGKTCYTVINADLAITPDDSPLLTVKQSFPVSAFAEILGYLRAYTNAEDFASIGSTTWFANANDNQAWLNNQNRIGENDMGKVYGAIGRDFGGIDLLHKVYDNLRNGIDDRGEILTFWKPDEFDKGCLRPCMHTHHFSLIGDTLHLTSYQRSADVPLGLNYNSIQCYLFLAVMAKITGHKQGNVYHKIVNAHIYEDQMEGVKKMLDRKPLPWKGELSIKPWVQDLDDLLEASCVDGGDMHAREYVSVKNYYHHGKIDFPMTA